MAQRAVVDGTVELQPAFRWFVGLNIDDPVWDYFVDCVLD